MRSIGPALVLTAFILVLACGGGLDDPNPTPTPASSEPEAADGALDALFRGIERGCDRNEALSELLGSIAEPTPAGAWAPKPVIKAPQGLAAVFGAPVRSGGDSEHSRFSVPVTNATWHDLPVVRIDRWLGHSNGIDGFAIAIEGDRGRVEAILRSKLTITDSCAGDPDCPMEPAELTFTRSEGVVLAICDTSM